MLEEGLGHHQPPSQRAIFARLLHSHPVIRAGVGTLCPTGHSQRQTEDGEPRGKMN